PEAEYIVDAQQQEAVDDRRENHVVSNPSTTSRGRPGARVQQSRESRARTGDSAQTSATLTPRHSVKTLSPERREDLHRDVLGEHEQEEYDNEQPREEDSGGEDHMIGDALVQAHQEMTRQVESTGEQGGLLKSNNLLLGGAKISVNRFGGPG
ncbi:unnamed protein product, partial [Amoebophrya sp. A25]